MNPKNHRYTVFQTIGGFCVIAWNDAGISRFHLATKTAQASERNLLRHIPDATIGDPPPDVVEAIRVVRRYYEGEAVDFSHLKIDLDDHDALFRQIYEAVRQIRWGQTTTYGALATALGKERQAARDVGQAMARNSIPLIIPCHRVLAAGGKIGGFSAPGGSATKARMLELEGVQLGLDDAQNSFGF